MSAVFYRYQDARGTWVVTDRLDAVPVELRDDVERVVLSTSVSALPPDRGSDGSPEFSGHGRRQEDHGLAGAGLLQAVADRVPRFDVKSIGTGFGLGLGVFLVYAILKRSGQVVARLALVALVLGLVGVSLLGLWFVPRIPGVPEWLMTPNELVREAKRVADEAAPENRLGDLK